MSISPTRRSLLGAIAVAPLALSAISTAAAADDGTWATALARSKAADLAYGKASIAEEEAVQRWYDACKAIRPVGLIDRKWASLETQLHTTPLDEIEGLYEPPHVHEFGGGVGMAAAVARYREQRVALRESHQIAVHEQVMSEASKEWREAYDAAVETAVPTIAALADKIEMINHQTAACDELENLLDDVRRLAGIEVRS